MSLEVPFSSGAPSSIFGCQVVDLDLLLQVLLAPFGECRLKLPKPGDTNGVSVTVRIVVVEANDSSVFRAFHGAPEDIAGGLREDSAVARASMGLLVLHLLDHCTSTTRLRRQIAATVDFVETIPFIEGRRGPLGVLGPLTALTLAGLALVCSDTHRPEIGVGWSAPWHARVIRRRQIDMPANFPAFHEHIHGVGGEVCLSGDLVGDDGAPKASGRSLVSEGRRFIMALTVQGDGLIADLDFFATFFEVLGERGVGVGNWYWASRGGRRAQANIRERCDHLLAP